MAVPRCFDCLAPIKDLDRALCGRCEWIYADERGRRRAADTPRRDQ